MFPPTNESFIRANVESTIDRHMGESEEERAIREGMTYQNSHRFSSLMHGLGHLFLRLGERLDQIGTLETTDVSDARVVTRHAASHAR